MNSKELKSWEVTVRGLGGPMAEFWDRTYQVLTSSIPDAVAQALEAYRADDKARHETPHEVISISAHEGISVRALEPKDPTRMWPV